MANTPPQYHDQIYTRARPPHLNKNNFPSTVANGATIQPQADLQHGIENINLAEVSALPSDQSNTDSPHTLKAYDAPSAPGIHERTKAITYYLLCDILRAPSLTAEALKAFDHNNVRYGCPMNIHGWLRSGYTPDNDGISHVDMSESMMMPDPAASQVAETIYPTLTTSSSVNNNYHDRSSESVNGAGMLFAETPGPELYAALHDDDLYDKHVL